MEITRLKLKDLEPNTGQIDGLPINPRQWSKGDIDKLAKSLKETPELFEARPIIVVPHGDKFVILGGNMRYEASRQNGEKDVPCYVMPETLSVDKMKEIVIKDNGSFGGWDPDELANSWDDLPLADWGVPEWAGAPIDEGAADDLFQETSAAGKAQDLTLTITVPAADEGHLEDIKAAVAVTLQEWPRCTVK